MKKDQQRKIVILGSLAEALVCRLANKFPSVGVESIANLNDSEVDLNSATAVLAFDSNVKAAHLTSAINVEWIQALSSGTDNLQNLLVRRSGILLTSASGIHGPQMSELAIFQMLMLCRRGRDMVRNQEERRWARWEQPLLYGKTALIVGVGTVGRALAKRCKAFGMTVHGVVSGSRCEPEFDHLFTRNQLREAVSGADFTVVLTPYSTSTKNLIDDEILGAMRRDGFLINLARGELVSEPALISALKSSRIAGAALDVFENEPLPPEHCFWALPRTFITPHIGGMSDIYADQLIPVLEHNIEKYLKREFNGMINIVHYQGDLHASK